VLLVERIVPGRDLEVSLVRTVSSHMPDCDHDAGPRRPRKRRGKSPNSVPLVAHLGIRIDQRHKNRFRWRTACWRRRPRRSGDFYTHQRKKTKVSSVLGFINPLLAPGGVENPRRPRGRGHKTEMLRNVTIGSWAMGGRIAAGSRQALSMGGIANIHRQHNGGLRFLRVAFLATRYVRFILQTHREREARPGPAALGDVADLHASASK